VQELDLGRQASPTWSNRARRDRPLPGREGARWAVPRAL